MITTVAIVYHSGFGHTARQAEAVVRGASSVHGVSATAFDVGAAPYPFAELAAADAIIFGSPTYMGSVSGPFKCFMDKSSLAWRTRDWKDKLAAGFTNSGSQCGDKLSTLLQLAVFAAQHGMIWVGLDLMPGNNTSRGSVEDLNRLGSSLGATAQSNLDAGAEAPCKSDLATAEALGRRVSLAALRWREAPLLSPRLLSGARAEAIGLDAE